MYLNETFEFHLYFCVLLKYFLGMMSVAAVTIDGDGFSKFSLPTVD